MSTSTIHIVPEDDGPSPNVKKQVKYKLVKLPFDNKQSSKKQDGNKTHTQLFLKMTDKMESKKGIPSYYRGVCRVDEKVPHIYWYDAALKAYSGSTIIWSIDKAKMNRSKLRWIKRPRIFSIANTMLESRSVFKSSGGKNEPIGYSGEVVTPYDHSCVQMYEWVRYKDGSGWAFIFRNDPSKPLVELRKTSSRNEFEIVFLQDPPPGWSSRARQNSNVFNPFNHSPRSAGGHPSAFSNPSTSHRTSNTSNTSKERGFNTDDAERYWQEFVLASTVAIQDEVISSKKRLWKN